MSLPNMETDPINLAAVVAIEELTDEGGEDFKWDLAEAVVAAVTPLIRQQIADEIAGDEPPEYALSENWLLGWHAATNHHAYLVTQEGSRQLTGDPIVQATPETEQPDWANALVIRATGHHHFHKDTVVGLFMRDSDGTSWFHNYGHDAYRASELSDVAVVIDAEGRHDWRP